MALDWVVNGKRLICYNLMLVIRSTFAYLLIDLMSTLVPVTVIGF